MEHRVEIQIGPGGTGEQILSGHADTDEIQRPHIVGVPRIELLEADGAVIVRVHNATPDSTVVVDYHDAAD